MGCSKNTSGREVHSDKCLSQEIRKVSNNLNLHLEELEKEKLIKFKVSRMKKTTKIRE